MYPVHMTRAMVAAGLEADFQARIECMTDSERVMQIYLAMYGTGLDGMDEGEPGYIH